MYVLKEIDEVFQVNLYWGADPCPSVPLNVYHVSKMCTNLLPRKVQNEKNEKLYSIVRVYGCLELYKEELFLELVNDFSSSQGMIAMYALPLQTNHQRENWGD